ncbi:Raffinose synthase Sip1 [Mycena venus]|uniref:Raffinose synthase Sip1 n=1 Tax=Mycena venus TaxID=2733690 RepID=A0A8H6U1Z6_9AGAR|nr:Raffinose synthase Sip1 [Mycena venus]
MAYIAAHPPMSQVSQLKNADVKFDAMLEVPKSLEREPWQLALWHSDPQGGDGEWVESAFGPTGRGEEPLLLQPAGDHLAKLYFTAHVTVQSFLAFTIKFRQRPDHEWRWIRDEQGMSDGVVIVDGAPVLKQTSDNLADLIQGLNPDIKWKPQVSQSPGTRLWSMEVPVDGAENDTSGTADLPLGIPWGGFLRWFSLVRLWAPWLAPRHGKSTFGLDKDGILCAFLSPQGQHMVMIGISGLNDTMMLFRSDGSGRVMLHVRNDNTTPSAGTVLVAVGDNFEGANAAAMYYARNLVMTTKKSTSEYEAELATLADHVKPEWYENWYDGLGFCTWNALGQRLTDEKVIKAVDTLAEHNIKIVSLIIDDNWQNIDYRGDGQFQRGWNDFEAEPKAFPRGLKATVSEIRSKHKNIEHVAVWHALLGYWAGLSPDGKIAKTYKTVEVVREDALSRNLPLNGKMTVVAKEDVDKFYNDFYGFLSSCGIDGVKTDAQFMIDTWVSARVRREMINAYLDAWTIASLRHFSVKVISCMSQVPQILFYSQLPRNRPAILVRNSDDFFPKIPASHPWHIFANSFNSLLTQHLNILPDWDMFQTVHDYSGFHAAARCVSGGPIYITDVPGEHNIDLINQMTGMTPHGKTIIFRPNVLGRALDQYVGYDEDALLKVTSYHGHAVTGTSIMGIFNISARPLTDLLSLARFSGVLPSMQYIVRSHNTGMITPPLHPTSPASLLAISLDVRGYDILTAFPLSIFHSDTRGRVFLANLGLVGKMTGCAALLNSSFTLLENGRLFTDTVVKALGVLGIYISVLPDLSIEGDFMVTIQGQPIPPHTVTVNKADTHVLEVDIETAWKVIGLESGWANEVEVKIYFQLEK